MILQLIQNQNGPQLKQDMFGIGTAVGSIVGSVVGAESSKNAQRRQYEMDQNLMNQQFNQNVDMWNMQNAYNSPSAQMERMRKAGLNPAMMYGGKSGGQSGNAGAIAPVTPQRTQARNHGQAAMQGMMQFQDIKLKQAQTDNVNAQTEKNQEQSQLIAQQKLTEIQETNIRTYKSEMDKIKSENYKEYNTYIVTGGNRYKGIRTEVAKMLNEADVAGYKAGQTEIDFKILEELYKEGQQVAFFKSKTKDEEYKAALKAEELAIYEMAKLYLPAGKLGLSIVKAIFGK